MNPPTNPIPHARSFKLIVDTVAAAYEIAPGHIDRSLDKSRREPASWARAIAMAFCRELTDASLSRIGAYFANADHTSIIHAVKRVQDRCSVYPHDKQIVERLRAHLSAELPSIKAA